MNQALETFGQSERQIALGRSLPSRALRQRLQRAKDRGARRGGSARVSARASASTGGGEGASRPQSHRGVLSAVERAVAAVAVVAVVALVAALHAGRRSVPVKLIGEL